MPTSNVKESIDERILRLLGLEDVFDLDYDTYLTLLKEAMVKGRMPKTTIPTEEIEVLTDEYKRVKGKKNKGRFEVKKKKISSTSFNVGKVKGLISGSKEKKALPSAVSKSLISKSLDNNISAITDAVISISETLKQQKKTADDASSYDRRKSEQDKRSAAENKLEKRFEGLKKIAEKIIAPVKSILDKIINFLVNVLLGRIVIKLLDWFGDPKNASKVKSIIRFLGDWWPALLGAYVLFGTTFGKFVRGTVGMLGRFIFQIGKVAIPSLLKFVARHPLGTAATALFMTGAAAELVPGLTGKKEEETKKAPGSTKDKIQQLQQQKANLNIFEKLQGKGSEIDEQLSLLQTGKTKGYGFSGGGFNGFVSGEKGVDKIPAMLSDGEFVMSRGAVALHGVDTLERMNAAGGGTNQPKLISGVPHAYGGGLIGDVGPGRNSNSGKSDIQNIKDFIKYKIGFDVDKPSSWGGSFKSGIPGGGMPSRSFSGGINIGSLANQAQNSVNQFFLDRKQNSSQNKSRSGGSNPILSGLSGISSGLGKNISNIANNPYYGETAVVERERKLGLMKPGADALTKETKDRLAKSDNWIKSLYDPKKDKGPLGNVKKLHQDIQDKGFFADPLSLLKTEGFEKGVEKISGGRVKNFGAGVQGVQMSLKALAGPLGRMFRVEDEGSLGRYLRPAMMEAQKRGHGNVGAKALGQDLYNKLLPNKLANFALGQTAFSVDKSGRAMTGITGTSRDETWDFNQTAEKNFGQSRQALKAFGNILQGKGASIGEGKNIKKLTGPKGALKALYEAGFKGMSGIYRTLQNTTYGNLRPMGSNIDLGGGFKQTDSRGNVLSPQQIRQSNKVKPVKPPAKPQAKVVYGPPVPSRLNGKKGSAPKSNVPNFTAGTPGMRSKQETLGLMR